MEAEVRERFERIEANMLQFSEGMKELRNEFSREMRDVNARLNDFAAGMKELREAQGRTNEVLHTLLDALFTQRGNGHSKQQPPE